MTSFPKVSYFSILKRQTSRSTFSDPVTTCQDSLCTAAVSNQSRTLLSDPNKLDGLHLDTPPSILPVWSVNSFTLFPPRIQCHHSSFSSSGRQERTNFIKLAYEAIDMEAQTKKELFSRIGMVYYLCGCPGSKHTKKEKLGGSIPRCWKTTSKNNPRLRNRVSQKKRTMFEKSQCSTLEWPIFLLIAFL